MQIQTFAFRTGLFALTAATLVACGTTPPPPRPGVPPPAAPAANSAPLAASPKATFARPAAGPVLGRFDGKRNKGIDIGGKPGDPINAAADGRVALVSSALRGYGTMVIIKHNDTFLTAYAHLQRSLVKEGDTVRQGQPIAEMGKTGTDRVKLHFEIRKDGAAVDPEPYLSGKLR